jgi:hypothetical protein
MSSYPKLITDVDEKYKPLFEAMYFHERKRLGMAPDIFIQKCPLCPVDNIENSAEGVIESNKEL